MNEIDGPHALELGAAEIAHATQHILDHVLPHSPRRSLVLWLASLVLKREWGSVSLLRFQWRHRHFFMERHLDSDVVRRLCNDPRLRRQLTNRLGDDVILWRSEIWVSRPDECLIPAWHRDTYPRLLGGNGRTINAYIALTDIDAENGFEYLSMSHRAAARIEVANIDPYSGNGFLHVPRDLEETAMPVRLRAGEFALFPDDLVHRSLRNTSGRTRVSLTLRLATPSMQIQPGYSAILKRVAL